MQRFGTRAGIVSTSAILSTLRFQATEAVAADATTAAAPTASVAAEASTPSAPQQQETKDATAPVAPKSWSVYRPPAWRLVGVVDHARVRALYSKRSLSRKNIDADETFVLQKSPQSIAEATASKAGAVPSIPPASAATTYFFFGESLGPRPLVVLDEVLPYAVARGLFDAIDKASDVTATDNAKAALSPLTKYEPMLAALGHKHGVLSLPLVGPKGYDTPESLANLPVTKKVDFLSFYADAVVTMLDTMGIQFATIVARSTGALIASKLALLYPERVGGLIVCDTPLVGKHWVENDRIRKEILEASEDVNVPKAELEFAVRSLLEKAESPESEEGLESPLAVPFVPSPPGTASLAEVEAFNKALYESVIFDKTHVFPTKLVVPTTRGDAARNGSKPSRFKPASVRPDVVVVPRNAATAAKYLTSLAKGDELDGGSAKLAVPLAIDRKEDASAAAASSSPEKEIADKNYRRFLTKNFVSVDITEGLYRKNLAYVDPSALAAIRHPMLLVQPSGPNVKVASDANLHKNYFNLRKPTPISLGGGAAAEEAGAAKGGKDKKGDNNKGNNKEGKDKKDAAPAKPAAPAATSIYDAAVSSAFAKQVAAFMNRFELDVTLGKRYEQTAADLLRSMTNAQSVGGVSADSGDGKKGKGKKEKAGKKQ